MIDLTIKTLDSQNRAFNVPEDFTVRQLKEHIAESVNIAPDVQRLIYCGRVLVDENKLSQYNVNGKVIHLVERAPPSSTSRGDPDGGVTSGEAAGGMGGWRFLGGGGDPRRRRGRGQDNTMYLGAMAFPADLMDARGMSMPQARPCLTTSRLLVARSMLNQASRSLARLENPRTTASEASTGTAAEPSSSQESAAPTPGASRRDSTSDSQSEDNDETNLTMATQAATAAALVSAVSAVMQDSAPTSSPSTSSTQASQSQDQDTIADITIEEIVDSATREATEALSMLDDTEDAESPISPIVLSPETPPGMETEPTAPPAPATPAPAADTPPSQGAETSGSNAPGGARTAQPARPQCMATIIAQLDELNRRLEPFMTQYYNLLHHDPNYEDPEIAQAASEYNYPRSAADADLLFRSISEIMHGLSHSYHALSDVVCSYTRQPAQGRVLRCRPVLIQHSAVLHAPVPVLVERAAQNSNRAAGVARDSATSSATTAAPQNATTNTSSNTTATPNAQDSNTTPSNTGAPRPSFAPNNLDILMELGPTITIDSVEATFLPRGSAQQGSAGTGGVTVGNIATGAFPWGTPPPPELIQNLVQAVSERMGEAGEANIHIAFPETLNAHITIDTDGVTSMRPTATTAASATSPSGGVRAPDSTQNSQARGNTETHPTTATQTRSTSRPQILLARNLQSVARNFTNTLRTYDPFLPCNSHHIRNRRNGSTRSTQSQAWQSGANNNNNNNNAATQANNARSTTSSVSADFFVPSSDLYPPGGAAASAPFRNIVDSILSSVENLSQNPQGPGATAGPNILALGPFSTGGATANISFEIGRVTPMALNAGLASMMGGGSQPAAPQTAGRTGAASDSPLSPPISEQGAAQGGNAGGGVGGGFLSSLLGQLGNFLPQGANVELLNGMRNAGGVSNPSSAGEEQAGAGPWVEISSGRRPPADFMANLLHNFTGVNAAPPPHIHIVRPQAAAVAGDTPPAVNTPTRSAPTYPVLSSLMQTLQSHEGALQTTTVAQLLGLSPIESPTVGAPRSCMVDLIYTLLSTVEWRDLIPGGNAESRERSPTNLPELRAFMTYHFPGSVTRDSVSQILRLILNEMESYFNSLPNVLSRLGENIDLRGTLELLNSRILVSLFYAMEAAAENRPGGYSSLLGCLKAYTRTLLAVLGLCFDSSFLPWLLRMIAYREIAGIVSNENPSFASSEHSQVVSVLTVLKSLVREITQEVQGTCPRAFLVHITCDNSRPPQVGVTPQVTSNPGPRGGEPMDIEAAADVSQVASAPVNTRPDDPLPDNIIIGSESWHNTIPSDWVPIITRDSQRQRRESNQGPFSDAYLSGMPTKRRKIVTSSKPSNNLSKVLTDTMSTALGAAGVSTSSDAIASGAAEEPALRYAYREQIREQLGESLASSSDFSAERYPNAAKFFNSKKKQ